MRDRDRPASRTRRAPLRTAVVLTAAVALVASACTSSFSDGGASADIAIVGDTPRNAIVDALADAGAGVHGDGHENADALAIHAVGDNTEKHLESDAAQRHLGEGKPVVLLDADDRAHELIKQQTGFAVPHRAPITSVRRTQCTQDGRLGTQHEINVGPVVVAGDGPVVTEHPTTQRAQARASADAELDASASGAEQSGVGREAAPRDSAEEAELLREYAADLVPSFAEQPKCRVGGAPDASTLASATSSDPKTEPSADDSRTESQGDGAGPEFKAARADVAAAPAATSEVAAAQTAPTSRVNGIELRWVYQVDRTVKMTRAYADSPSDVIAYWQNAEKSGDWTDLAHNVNTDYQPLDADVPKGEPVSVDFDTVTIAEAFWPTKTCTKPSSSGGLETFTCLGDNTNLTVSHVAVLDSESTDNQFDANTHKSLGFPSGSVNGTSILDGYRGVLGAADSFNTSGKNEKALLDVQKDSPSELTEQSKKDIEEYEESQLGEVPEVPPTTTWNWGHYKTDQFGASANTEAPSACTVSQESGFLNAAYENTIVIDNSGWSIPATSTAITPTDQNATVTKSKSTSSGSSSSVGTSGSSGSSTSWNVGGNVGTFNGEPMGGLTGGYGSSSTSGSGTSESSGKSISDGSSTSFSVEDWTMQQSHPSGKETNGVLWQWHTAWPQNLSPWDAKNGLTTPDPLADSAFWQQFGNWFAPFSSFVDVAGGNDGTATVDPKNYNVLNTGRFLTAHQVEFSGPINANDVTVEIADTPYWIDEFSICDVYTQAPASQADGSANPYMGGRKLAQVWNKAFTHKLELDLQCASNISIPYAQTVTLLPKQTCLSMPTVVELVENKSSTDYKLTDAKSNLSNLTTTSKGFSDWWTSLTYASTKDASNQLLAEGFNNCPVTPAAASTSATTTTSADNWWQGSDTTTTTAAGGASVTPCLLIGKGNKDSSGKFKLNEDQKWALSGDNFGDLLDGQTVELDSSTKIQLPSDVQEDLNTETDTADQDDAGGGPTSTAPPTSIDPTPN